MGINKINIKNNGDSMNGHLSVQTHDRVSQHDRIFQPYPKYKNSNIPWLGEIPEHWEIKRVKWILQREKREIRPEDDVVTAFRDGQVTLRKNRRADGYTIAIQEHGYQGIRVGDLVIHGMDAFAGAIGVSDSDGKASPVYNACTLKGEGNIWYYCWIVRQMSKSGFIESLAKGIRERSTDFRFDIFSKQLLPAPPKQEQTAIARFLDYKLAKINRFIQKKKQLIKLLNEQKAAIINQAVTKGIKSTDAMHCVSTKMKDSGIEWLGKIPEHWEIWKLGRAYKYFGSGTTPSSGYSQYYENGTIPWINTGDLNDGVLYDCEKKITQAAFDDYSVLKIFPKGTISVAMYGASIGKISIIDFEATTNQACCNFYSSSILIDKFTFLWFIANKTRIVSLGYGGTQPNISQGLIKALRIPVPTLSEQQQIVSYIESETATINTTISTIEKEIALVEEYKTALIAEAVTGKIDVRGYEVPEITEEETYDDPDSYREEEEISMAAEDAEEYETIEE